MITGIFGDLGSGKTLTLTMYAQAYSKLGYNIFSNYHLSFKHKKIDKAFLETVVEKNKDFGQKAAVFLDEFDMYVDSRSSMSKGNLLISYFIKQIRKKNIVLFYATQMEHTIDKRLRGLTRVEIISKGKDIFINLEDGSQIFLKIIFNEIFINKKSVVKKRFIGNKYFDLYDTKELIVD